MHVEGIAVEGPDTTHHKLPLNWQWCCRGADDHSTTNLIVSERIGIPQMRLKTGPLEIGTECWVAMFHEKSIVPTEIVVPSIKIVSEHSTVHSTGRYRRVVPHL